MARVSGKHGPKRYADKDRSILGTSLRNRGDGSINKAFDLTQFSASRCAILSWIGQGENGES